MGSFSGLGIGLSFLFGFILMGLVCELYYLLFWKNKIEGSCFFFTRKTPTNGVAREQQPPDLEAVGPTKVYGEEGIEAEIMRAHSLRGPPRFLCTIREESKEDLESEDGKRSRTKSLSDLSLGPLSDSDHGGFRSSSPPPKLKFLKDAEDKLIRKLVAKDAERKLEVMV